METFQEISKLSEGFKPFEQTLEEGSLYPFTATGVKILQVNVGRLCNLSCRHCHVDAGPGRTEVMTKETMGKCIDALKSAGCHTLDITGGAPEMNPEYRWFVTSAVDAGVRVITRTNLTVLLEPGFEDMPAFFAENKVEVVASLPYYLSSTTDRLRGGGVFDASVEAIKRLNAAGYGVGGSELALNLVYNPCGAFLPPSQKAVEADFRRELDKRHGVSFTGLFTITNMPIGRFLKFLKKSGNLTSYFEKLKKAYNPSAAENAMCRQLVSVGWDGTLYDCDFNQMLGLKCGHGAPRHIRDFDEKLLAKRRIVTGTHCYGCTAGAGSSCTGEVA